MLKKLGRIVIDVTENDLDLEALLQSPYTYEEGLVKIIEDGELSQAFSFTDVLEKEGFAVIKIEGLEKLNVKLFMTCNEIAKAFGHQGPVTCHLFKSPVGGISFPMHTDPDDVLIFMVKGNKIFKHDHGTVLLKEGEVLSIPRNNNHQAENIEDTIMLSFGLERFISEKL